jgi:hypothetical protein
MEGRTVDCGKCGTILSPGAVFCPRCGAAGTDAGIGEDGLDEVKAARRRIFLTGFACLFIGLLLGSGSSWFNFGGGNGNWGNWGNWGGPPAAAWGGRPPIAASADQLYETYRDDEDLAQRRYSNRPLVVTGTVLRLDQHPRFGPDILLRTSDAVKPLRVDLLPDSHDASDSLQAGDAIIVGCRRVEEHIGPDPWLRDCRIQEAGEGVPPLPGAAPAPPRPPSGS